ncbi:MAG: GIY-YIG nuclease family protein [Promethearchaeati archaeon]
MKGSYILIIELAKSLKLKIGALGEIEFFPGFYAYIGSAMGKIGSSTLLNRVKRHLKAPAEKKSHWHIDYLLNDENTNIVKILLCPCKTKLECILADEIKNNADDLILGFGCSDCKCDTHLFYFKDFYLNLLF